MENTTKALLIAGAVLIVILLIVFGIRVFNSPKDVIEDAKNIGESIAFTIDRATASIKESFNPTHKEYGSTSGSSSDTGESSDLTVNNPGSNSQQGSEQYSIWVDNGNGTFTSNGITVEIGDYVDYQEGNFTHTPDPNKGAGTNSSTTGPSTEKHKLSTGILTTVDLKWRALGVNEKGQLELISDNQVEGLVIANDTGYLYIEENLNNYCNDLYGKGTNGDGKKVAEKARSLKAEDINKITGFKKENYEINFNHFWYTSLKYGNEYKFKSTQNENEYIQGSSNGGNTWKNTKYKTFLLPGEEQPLSINNPGEIEIIFTYYMYYIPTELPNNKYKDMIEKMLRANDDIIQYLASPVVNVEDGYATFGINIISRRKCRYFTFISVIWELFLS